jgi:hypothetical protein
MSASPTAMADGVAHPAHIHDGTCANLGGVVYPLTDLTTPDMTATPMAGTTDMGTPVVDMDMSDAVAMSVTVVQADLNTILGSEHAINVHESAENIGTYIACGDLTGTQTGGSLQIGLQELNDSGFQGGAMLQDNGDGTTTVTVWLTHATGNGTPTASA